MLLRYLASSQEVFSMFPHSLSSQNNPSPIRVYYAWLQEFDPVRKSLYRAVLRNQYKRFKIMCTGPNVTPRVAQATHYFFKGEFPSLN